MTPRKRMPPLLLICLLCLAGVTGCARPAPLTCRDALAGGISQLSDDRLLELLDHAPSVETDGCWRSLVAACLRQNRTLPLGHLAEAVRLFNRQADVELFHLATRAYLTALASDNGRYRPQARAFLEAYIRLLIRQAHSSADDNLRTAQLLCQRLDPELYRRFFQNPEAAGCIVSY